MYIQLSTLTHDFSCKYDHDISIILCTIAALCDFGLHEMWYLWMYRATVVYVCWQNVAICDTFSLTTVIYSDTILDTQCKSNKNSKIQSYLALRRCMNVIQGTIVCLGDMSGVASRLDRYDTWWCHCRFSLGAIGRWNTGCMWGSVSCSINCYGALSNGCQTFDFIFDFVTRRFSVLKLSGVTKLFQSIPFQYLCCCAFSLQHHERLLHFKCYSRHINVRIYLISAHLYWWISTQYYGPLLRMSLWNPTRHRESTSTICAGVYYTTNHTDVQCM